MLIKFLLGVLLLTPAKVLMSPAAIALAFVHPAFLVGLVLPWIVALFAVRDVEPTSNDAILIRRGDLPRWLRWFGTHDERLPGGFYEPRVARIYSWINTRGYFALEWLYDIHAKAWSRAMRLVESVAFWATAGYWMHRNKLYAAGALLGVKVSGQFVTLGRTGRLGWANPGVAMYLIVDDGKVRAWELHAQYPYPWAKVRGGRRLGLVFRLGWKIEPLRWRSDWNDPTRADQMFVFSPRVIAKLDKGYR